MENANSLAAMLTGRWITDLSNTSAFIFQNLEAINWSGFYLRDYPESDSTLYLGPFQGRTACTLIPPGRGVCGKAFKNRETLVVDDVHSFPDHITCDERSQSEVVIPLILDSQCFGVLDVDSPIKSRFDEKTVLWLKEIVSELLNKNRNLLLKKNI